MMHVIGYYFTGGLYSF